MQKESGKGCTMRNFIVSPNSVRVIKSRRLRWTGDVARMEEERSAIKNFKVSLGKRALGRLRYRCKDHI